MSNVSHAVHYHGVHRRESPAAPAPPVIVLSSECCRTVRVLPPGRTPQCTYIGEQDVIGVVQDETDLEYVLVFPLVKPE